MPKLCGYILKLKLFGNPSNWCFHYLMIHFGKTPNKPFGTWLWVAICSDVIFLIWEDPSVSVNLNFLYEPMHPTCKAQSNICNKFPNKPRESRSVTFSFLLIFFERGRVKFCGSFHLEIGLWLYISFLWFQHIKFHEPNDLCVTLLEWKHFLLSVLFL